MPRNNRCEHTLSDYISSIQLDIFAFEKFIIIRRREINFYSFFCSCVNRSVNYHGSERMVKELNGGLCWLQLLELSFFLPYSALFSTGYVTFLLYLPISYLRSSFLWTENSKHRRLRIILKFFLFFLWRLDFSNEIVPKTRHRSTSTTWKHTIRNHTMEMSMVMSPIKRTNEYTNNNVFKMSSLVLLCFLSRRCLLCCGILKFAQER